VAIIEHERLDKPPDPQDPILKPRPAEPKWPKLLEAAEVVRQRGWIIGCAGVDPTIPQVCALGAVAVSMTGKKDWAFGDDSTFPCDSRRSYKEVTALARSLGWEPGYTGFDEDEFPMESATFVYKWNDQLERTKEQVIEALERAAYGV
jgi:hypothetical protein